MKKIVTFDFDGTLTREDVQSFAKELISEGIEVWILTSRFDKDEIAFNIRVDNSDINEVAKSLSIDKIIYTRYESKSYTLYDSRVLFHLDNDVVELEDILYRGCKTIGISVKEEGWKDKCLEILNQTI